MAFQQRCLIQLAEQHFHHNLDCDNQLEACSRFAICEPLSRYGCGFHLQSLQQGRPNPLILNQNYLLHQSLGSCKRLLKLH